jgi:hypothetical protein
MNTKPLATKFTSLDLRGSPKIVNNASLHLRFTCHAISSHRKNTPSRPFAQADWGCLIALLGFSTKMTQTSAPLLMLVVARLIAFPVTSRSLD